MQCLSLIVPIYNESGNIVPLVESFVSLRAQRGFPFELVLVNNGSVDTSAQEIAEVAGPHPWIKTLTLSVNRGYGGGVYFGLQNATRSATHLGWLPADGQYDLSDLNPIWQAVQKEPAAIHKGFRTQRHDGIQSGIVSRVYTFLCRLVLGLRIKDINGLPKIFPASFFERLTFEPSPSFVWDVQLLLAAKILHLPIRETEVKFLARRAGVSSWSGKRIATYRRTMAEMWRMREQSRGWELTSERAPIDTETQPMPPEVNT